MTDKTEPAPGLLTRYTTCAERIWALFSQDPLPAECEVQTWVERLEALLDYGLLVPRTDPQTRKTTRLLRLYGVPCPACGGVDTSDMKAMRCGKCGGVGEIL